MAEAFPKSEFVGFDFHDGSIADARRHAKAQAKAGNVRFEVSSAKTFPGRGYDLVTFFDCLHDMGDPAGAARHVHDELTELMRGAGFRDVAVQAKPKTLQFPAPADFLWQYIYSTPLAEAATKAREARCAALEHDVCVQWQEFVVNGSMSIQVGMTTATALK